MSSESDSSNLIEDVAKFDATISPPEGASEAIESEEILTERMAPEEIAPEKIYSDVIYTEEMDSAGMSSEVMASSQPHVEIYKRWWGFELHCNEAMVNQLNDMRNLILTILSRALPEPIPSLVSAYILIRQEVIKAMSKGNGVKLISPWTSPLMLTPRPLDGEIRPQQDTAMRWTVFESGGWSAPQMFPAHHSYTAPALAEHNGRLICVHRGGANDEGLWYTIYDPETGWSDDQQISGQRSRLSPVLATFNGMLYCAYRGKSNDERLYWTMFNGRSWTAGRAFDHGSASRSSPALAGFRGQLYCVHRASSGSEYLWVQRFNGSSWSPGERLPHNMSSREGPALCVFQGRLYCVSRGQSGDERLLWRSTGDGTNWNQSGEIPGQRSDYRPGLAVLNNKLVCSYRGRGTKALWSTTFNGSSWSSAHSMSGHQSENEPDLCFYRDGNTPGQVDNHGQVKDQIMCVYRGIKR